MKHIHTHTRAHTRFHIVATLKVCVCVWLEAFPLSPSISSGFFVGFRLTKAEPEG